MKSIIGAIAFMAGVLAPGLARAAPPVTPVQRDLLTAIEQRQEPANHRRWSCHTPSNRACWQPGFDIHTDYELNTPFTGVVRKYTLIISEATNWMGPDGVVKAKVMLINGKFLGPTIFADWGDTIEVKVINNLQTDGTSMHWHGIRQMGSPLHDGTNGVTECPIAPKGGSRTYRFLASQYGTSWYHSHFSAQYGNGVAGTMQINGPASLPYDIDLGVFPIGDYYYKTAEELVTLSRNNFNPPFSDNVLFNGTNVHPVTGAGKYASVTLTPGKRHRLRLINMSVENHFQVSLVKHTMTVIAADLVPVNAMTVDSLFLAIGQRYDVTIDASQVPGNYWFNVTFSGANACGGSVNPTPAAIFHYDGVPAGLPADRGVAPPDHQCLDLLNLTPVVTRSVPASSFVPAPGNTVNVHVDMPVAGTPMYVWKINGSAVNVDWNKPVMDYVLAGNAAYPRSENIVQVDAVNQWTYWLIVNDPDAPAGFVDPHPMHLHGHDFLILGRSPPTSPSTPTRYVFNPATDMGLLQGTNPARRDVTMLPARGWLLLAFQTNNPGAWLLHCHIAWHVSGGMAVDFLERAADLRAQTSAADRTALADVCRDWARVYPNGSPFKTDSGLKVREGERWVTESGWLVR